MISLDHLEDACARANDVLTGVLWSNIQQNVHYGDKVRDGKEMFCFIARECDVRTTDIARHCRWNDSGAAITKMYNQAFKRATTDTEYAARLFAAYRDFKCMSSKEESVASAALSRYQRRKTSTGVVV